MLLVKDLKASIEGNQILSGVDFCVNPGEIHVIMGPNGSGKSSLVSILAGHPKYDVNNGSISFMDEEISELEPDERAKKGIFMAFQYPVEIPGIKNSYFIKTCIDALRKDSGLEKSDASLYLKELKGTAEKLDIKKDFLSRNVNQGFSGGEKKKNEILQMSMLKPKLALLDEIDSGLDIDALKSVGKNINELKNDTRSMIVVTHYPRLLKYLDVDFVHVFFDGKIVKSGEKELADYIEQYGYNEWTL